ncbi:hypothetical protein MHM84_03410 [Halomonas sp. McH1-25]|uniref:hypothetical protein n=1 Tax=unclassified Halomonas TaxID=2609666 RepID=UPI001EF3FFB0|nr:MULTISPECIES: hypothetical protein [unclassified Halomonas]MCG7598819.1 hypothetical protein [Halomonas sp. McH1-25]MCP1340782.1 hypothetical protein [Halomonas sp. FL8]MCP1362205.1 hypothetical protein [Halomonas sp. BBD45]MCP1364821.1 hypothetical protein [Halomonas sp. BBD48]
MKMLYRATGKDKEVDWLKVARDNGISENTYWQRVHRLGLSEREAATRPLYGRGRETRTLIAKRYGINCDSIDSWRRRHPEQRDRPLEEIAQIIANNKRARA